MTKKQAEKIQNDVLITMLEEELKRLRIDNEQIAELKQKGQIVTYYMNITNTLREERATKERRRKKWKLRQ